MHAQGHMRHGAALGVARHAARARRGQPKWHSPRESTAESAAICLRKHQPTQRPVCERTGPKKSREMKKGGEMKKAGQRNEEMPRGGAEKSSLYFQQTHHTPDHATVEHTSVNTPSLSVCSPPGPATCMLALRAGPQRARRRRTDKTTTVGREGIRAW